MSATMEMAGPAQRLWIARKLGRVVPLEAVPEPASIEVAYAIQAEAVRLSGCDVRGFKVGSTSKEAQRLLGTTEPGSAPVLAPYLHASPARMSIVPLQAPAVEGEFAFRLGRDLPPRSAAYAAGEVMDAIDAVAGAIEVVGTRIAGGLAGKGRFLTTADGGANVALITGPWNAGWRGLDLKSHRVVMRINGEPRGEGVGAHALGDPINVMVWLANQQSRFGRGLQTGHVVATGTCTGLAAIGPGDHAAADFGQLGLVEVVLQ